MNEWWRGAVIYQIYPRSFLDSNGDGVGDLPGITSRLGHVASLGVDGIWLSPFFTSPMKDFGYDVADYCDVDPLFGRLADFDALLAEAHRAGPQGDHRPGLFALVRQAPVVSGEPAEPRQPQGRLVRLGRSEAGRQPAQQLARGLRRRRLGVGAAPAAVLPAQLPQGAAGPQPAQSATFSRRCWTRPRFWLDRGVDGFRLDVANFFMHDLALRDNPARPHPAPDKPSYLQRQIYNRTRPETLSFVARLRALLDRYPGADGGGRDRRRGPARHHGRLHRRAGALPHRLQLRLSRAGVRRPLHSRERRADAGALRKRLAVVGVQQPRRRPGGDPLGRRAPPIRRRSPSR